MHQINNCRGRFTAQSNLIKRPHWMLWKRKPPFTSALWPQQIDSSQILLMLLAVDDRSWETSRSPRSRIAMVLPWSVCDKEYTGERVTVFLSMGCPSVVLRPWVTTPQGDLMKSWDYEIGIRRCIVYTDISSVSSSVPSLLHSITGITVLKIIYGHVLIVFFYTRKWQ